MELEHSVDPAAGSGRRARCATEAAVDVEYEFELAKTLTDLFSSEADAERCYLNAFGRDEFTASLIYIMRHGTISITDY